MDATQTLELFPTEASCVAHLERVRWSGKPTCPYCGSFNTVPNYQHRHRCYNCRTSFSVTVGTVFHRTHVPLQKWFLAIVLMLGSEKAPSALQLSRDLNVNKNTAWRIATQIHQAMAEAENRELLVSVIQADDTSVTASGTRSK